MSALLLAHRNVASCVYGCCGYPHTSKEKGKLRRQVKRSERQSWKSELRREAVS